MTQLNKLIATLLLSSPAMLLAQGFQVNLQGQKQQAMGGAGTALPQDAATVFFNPGAISFLKQNQFTLGVSPTIAKGVFLEDNTNVLSQTKSPVSYPFTYYGAYAINEKLKVGLGAYTPFGSTMKWENGWSGRFALTKLQLFAVFIQPTLSYKINEKWGIGGGFVYATGKVNLQKDLPIIDNSGNYATASLSGNANGFGGNFGIYYKPTEKLSFGLTYRTQVNMKVNSGKATFNVPSSLADQFPNTTFKSSLPLPQVLTLGIAYKATDKLTLAFDANFVGWKAYKKLEFDYKDTTATLQNTISERNYKNTYSFRLGGQYMVTEKFAARLGLSYLITPIQSGYVTPEVPDATRLNFTGGLGYKVNDHFTVDASFTFENLKRSDKNKETNLMGTYKTYIYVPGISVIYNF
ncbi:MAG: outer membrane protein transport protein [Bacteroidetes bacterium]|nr:outer membrane protein transport protein [Bacteroidota bacterium]